MKRYFKVVGASSSSTPTADEPDPKRHAHDGDGTAGMKTDEKFGITSEPSGPTQPLRFLSWNMNGLLPRLKCQRDFQGFQDLVRQRDPDIIALQEVRLPARKDGSRLNRCRMDMGKTKDQRADFSLVESTIMKMDYGVLLSLSDRRYAGVALMVKRPLMKHVKSVRYNLDGAVEPHHQDGRLVIVEFESLTVMCTYVPNHGWNETSFQRRALWDQNMLEFLRGRSKPLVWLGDCNVSHRDGDLSHPEYFHSQKSDKDPLPTNPDYRGQPGCAPCEQRRFDEMLREGQLLDTYRYLHPVPGPEDFTWRGSPSVDGGWAKYWGKGMRIDYILASQALLQDFAIVEAEVLGRGRERAGFLGSDHCPILLVLEKKGSKTCEDGDKKEAAAATTVSRTSETGIATDI